MKEWEDIVEMEFGNKLHEIAQAADQGQDKVYGKKLGELLYFFKDAITQAKQAGRKEAITEVQNLLLNETAPSKARVTFIRALRAYLSPK